MSAKILFKLVVMKKEVQVESKDRPLLSTTNRKNFSLAALLKNRFFKKAIKHDIFLTVDLPLLFSGCYTVVEY